MISKVSSLHANVHQYEVFIMNRNENEVLKVLKMIYIQTFAYLLIQMFRKRLARYIIASVILQGKKVFFIQREKVSLLLVNTDWKHVLPQPTLQLHIYSSASCSSASTVHAFIVVTAEFVKDTIRQTTIKSTLQYDSWLWRLISLPSSTDTVELWTSHHQVTPLNIQYLRISPDYDS